MKQYVKTYHKKIGDFRQKTKDMSIEEQINQDLEKNPNWFIHILQHKLDGNSCTVVFNCNESLTIQPNSIDMFTVTSIDSSTNVGDITAHNMTSELLKES